MGIATRADRHRFHYALAQVWAISTENVADLVSPRTKGVILLGLLM